MKKLFLRAIDYILYPPLFLFVVVWAIVWKIRAVDSVAQTKKARKLFEG